MTIHRFQLGEAGAIRMLKEWAKQAQTVILRIEGDLVQTLVEGTLLGPDEPFGNFVHTAAGVEIHHSFILSDFDSFVRTVSDDPIPIEALALLDQGDVVRLLLMTRADGEALDIQVASKYVH